MKDLVILGNGMAGMTAALYAKRANLDFEIIGKNEYEYGQIADAILVENFPSIEPMPGFDLADKLHDQLISNEIKIQEHYISTIERKSDNGTFRIISNDGWYTDAISVIYALGCKHNELKCNNEANAPFHYCAICDGPLYKGKSVTVIGGGDAAFTQAEYLSNICEFVSIVMCDRNVTAFPSTFNRVSKIPNVQIIYDFPVSKIIWNEKLQRYSLFCDNMPIHSININGIFVAIGMNPNTRDIITRPDINYILDEQGYIISDIEGNTACLGFFAAGDVKQKRLRQALTAAADGANAVQLATQYIQRYK